MAVLVYAEHDNAALKAATLNAVTAAKQLGDVTVLVAGSGCGAVAEAAAKIDGVSKVLVADDAAYANEIAENVAPLMAGLADGFDYIVAAATTSGKNVMPRVAALLDVQQISDISGIEGPDTFIRPIYAGNALATVKTTDAKKVLTVRGTAFDAAAAEGGSAAIEPATAAAASDLTAFVGQELTKSERPELTAAKVIISGGRGMQSGDN
ncbi:MAG TPA: electron transfer flavoprotein subunit alpha, partial [Rhodospirillaceae bacterium]|nr:electron transfer flavoprotein subunit alpha [Rhodospirillaceae bacterium]